MQAGIKKIIVASIVSVVTIATISIGRERKTEALQSTNRNELYSPDEYNVAVSSKDGYTKVYENKNFEYYYSSHKTILKIVNKKSGFVWSTGADTDTTASVSSRCGDVEQYSEDYYSCFIDVGPNGNGSDNENAYSKINALMHFTFFDPKTTTSITGRPLTKATNTSFYGHNTLHNEFMFKMTYQTFVDEKDPSTLIYDFSFNLRFTFTDTGFQIHMFDKDIGGQSKDLVEAVYPLPRLGQSGGKIINGKFVDEDGDGIGSMVFDDITKVSNNPKTNLSGYIFVPDGSGALIRFDDVKYYDANKSFYFDVYGDPYRESPEKKEFESTIYVKEPDHVVRKQITMPVWGVAYGNNQDAFVSYVTSGEEYFGLYYEGRSTTFEYSSIQPRFERNRIYTFNFGSKKSPFILDGDECFHYDIGLNYEFLSGDGSDGQAPASYVGMALRYRNYLETNHLIKENVDLVTGPKVDFLICDVKEGLFGFSDVNVTTCDDIIDIYDDLHADGIENITSTLYGWQKGGISKAKPWKAKYNKAVGGKKGFKKVTNKAKEYGYDVSFYQQYGMINAEQVASFNAYCVKALSRDYGAYVLSDANKPITWWEYVNANVASNWLMKQIKKVNKLDSSIGITTGGISTLLIPDYGKDLSYSDAKNAIYQATKEAATKTKLSADTPNSYLWQNYDNHFNISVYNSQLQCETDSVPFLEIVLGGKVNLYAEYANFSFYDTVSQLKMIDYNLNPSFIISAKENNDIMYTNARDWFTTAYSSYHNIIVEICQNVLPYLNMIKGKTMINRNVVEFDDGSLGLYINEYASTENGIIDDSSKVTLAINYLDHDVSYSYNGKTYNIQAESACKLD